jgi:hypothetical protein
MIVNYAQLDEKTAGVWSEFGEQFARRKFGDVVVDCLPRKTRGPHKGSFKAEISWIKIVRGGWQWEPFKGVERRVGKIVGVILTSKSKQGLIIHAFEGDHRYFHETFKAAKYVCSDMKDLYEEELATA